MSPRFAVLVIGVALFSGSIRNGFAIDWLTEPVPGYSAQRGAYLCAMVSDRADRDHLVFATTDGTNPSLRYVLRANRTAALAPRTLSSSAFSHVAIDVTPDFRVFVAGVRSSDATVIVYEFKEGEFSIFATAATGASTASARSRCDSMPRVTRWSPTPETRAPSAVPSRGTCGCAALSPVSAGVN